MDPYIKKDSFFEAALYNKYLKYYVEDIKRDKMIIESNGIHIDSSTMYESQSNYFFRVHAKLCVKSNYRAEIFLSEKNNKDLINYCYNNIVFYVMGMLDKNSFIDNEWTDVYFDIELQPYFDDWYIYDNNALSGFTKINTLF